MGAGSGEPRFPLPDDVLARAVHSRTQADQWRRSRSVLDQWIAAWNRAWTKLAAPPFRGTLPEAITHAWWLKWARNTLVCHNPRSIEDVAALCELGRAVDHWFGIRRGPVYRNVEFTLYDGHLSAPGQGREPVPRITPRDAMFLRPVTPPGLPDSERSLNGRFSYQEFLRRAGFLLTDEPLSPGQDDFLRRLGYDIPEWCRDEPPGDTRHYVTGQITERCQKAIRELSRSAGIGPRTLPADRPLAEVLDDVERWLVEATDSIQPSSRVLEASFDEVDLRILRALTTAAPRRLNQYEIEADSEVSRRTVGMRLPRLESLGLVSRRGQRGGWSVTVSGTRALSRCALPAH